MRNFYGNKYLHTVNENNIQPLLSNKRATKLSTPCVITAIHHLTMQSHMSYSLCSCFVCLTGPYKFVYFVLEQLQFGSLSTILSY